MKRFYITFGFIFVLVLVLILVSQFYFKNQKNNLVLSELQKDISSRDQMIKNDTFGGKTPQETLDLFIKALEQENPELISKYFVYEKQSLIKNYYQDLKDKNQWPSVTEDLEKLKDSSLVWDKQTENFYYLSVETVGEDGSLNKDAVFAFKRYDNSLWKIE